MSWQACAKLPGVTEISALHDRYVDAVNRKRADLVAELFTAEAVWDLGSFGRLEGRPAIEAGIGELFAHWSTIFHVIHRALVVDDGGTARGRLWFTESGIRDGVVKEMAGCFHDRYERDEAGVWRFAWRRHDLTMRRTGDVREPVDFPREFDDWLA